LQEQLSSLLGDALLSASFLTYAGALDHRSRAHLLDEWADTLTRLVRSITQPLQDAC
jgi:hypothetical protein